MTPIVIAGFYAMLCLGVTLGFVACALFVGTDRDDIPDPPRSGYQPRAVDGATTNPPPRRS